MAIYIKNTTYIDWQSLKIYQGNLEIEEGIGGGINFPEMVPDTAFDGNGKIVTTSFVCAHHHAYSALARGMPPPAKQPHNFPQILEYIWWNLDKKLDKEMIRASALVTALDCVKNGCTFIIDHHASPYAIPGSLELMAECFEKVGINHLLCYEISDRDGEKIREDGLEETLSYLNKHDGLVGLHASFTVGDQLMKAAVDICEKFNTGIHIHVAEDNSDQRHCMDTYNTRIIHRLHKYGVLNFPKTILAHCIHLDSDERLILSDAEAWIAVNSESNLNNNVGLFSNKGDLEEKVVLGTDGMHSDMIRNSQINFLNHKNNDNLDLARCYQRLRRAHKYLESNNIAGDSDNNVVILDYDPPTPVSEMNWLAHFFYGLASTDINGTICNGKWVLKDNSFFNVDAAEIYAFSREQAKRLWELLV